MLTEYKSNNIIFEIIKDFLGKLLSIKENFVFIFNTWKLKRYWCLLLDIFIQFRIF